MGAAYKKGYHLDISITGIVAIVGNYGSGKTEVAINLAVNRKRSGLTVRIADLDLVNPYFRTREARNTLEALGIKVILPPQEYLQADLPILSPAIAGMIRQPDGLTLLFASDRVDGVGHWDLWMSRRESVDADWPEAVNLGPTVVRPAINMAVRRIERLDATMLAYQLLDQCRNKHD